MVDSSRIAAFSSACVLAVGLSGCGTTGPTVNNASNTKYEQANTAPLKVSRCEENGILVVDASNPYNLNQFYMANAWALSPASNGISSEAVGTNLMFYPSPIQQSSNGAGTLLSTGAGAAAGWAIGGKSTTGAALGGIIGLAVAPIANSLLNSLTHPFQSVTIRKIAECRGDLKAMDNATQALPTTHNVPPPRYMAPMPYQMPIYQAPYQAPRSPYGPYRSYMGY